MVPDLYAPLTDEELDRLGRFLLDRIDQDALTEDSDEGVLCVSELDGFFTAIVSGPVTLLPSQWLPALYGDFEPVWEAPEDAEAVLTLLVRHLNDIAGCLMHDPEHFEPIFNESLVGEKRTLVVDEWCEGYMRGVELAFEEWSAAEPEVIELLAPIRAFTADTNWFAHELDDPKELEILRDAIAPSACEIHAHWLRLRMADPPVAEPLRRDTPRVGRNDPCPCGSGKKYKKCCLQ